MRAACSSIQDCSVAGAPIIAHSTGHYPAGVPPTPRTCPREPEPNQSGSVKRNLAQAFVDESVATTHPNPPETVKSSRKSMGHDAQDPNSFLNAPLTPRYTPAKSVDGAPSERPSPKPSQTSQTPSQQKSNEKDALYWKFFASNHFQRKSLGSHVTGLVAKVAKAMCDQCVFLFSRSSKTL